VPSAYYLLVLSLPALPAPSLVAGSGVEWVEGLLTQSFDYPDRALRFSPEQMLNMLL